MWLPSAARKEPAVSSIRVASMVGDNKVADADDTHDTSAPTWTSRMRSGACRPTQRHRYRCSGLRRSSKKPTMGG